MVGGLVAPLGSRGVALAGSKPRYCRKAHPRRCKGFTCGDPSKHCDVVSGTGCTCIRSVEGCRACVDENRCGPACTSSAECVALPTFGPGSVCEAEGCGLCALTCMPPCPQ